MKNHLLLVGLALTSYVPAQSPARAPIDAELRAMFTRPAGTPISEEQKRELGLFLERHADRDLGAYGYARALHLYLTRDYDGAFKATDAFFSTHDAVPIPEHATMLGRIGLMGMMRGEDGAARARHAERAARLYPDAAMLRRALPRALHGLDADDQCALRLAVVRGVLAGERPDAERDAIIATIYAGGTNASAAAPVRVTLTGDDRMRFNTSEIRMKLGQSLEINFENVGTMPVEVMGHNLVILKPDADAMKFGVAAATAKATGYIPDSHRNQVLAHSDLLGPGESETVTFTPSAAGDYPYLCSFPGHFALMKGVIRVSR